MACNVIIFYTLQERLSSRGYIQSGSYDGWYSTSDEAFVPKDMVMERTEEDGQITHVSIPGICVVSGLSSIVVWRPAASLFGRLRPSFPYPSIQGSLGRGPRLSRALCRDITVAYTAANKQVLGSNND